MELMRAKENRVLNKRNINTESNGDKQRETKRRTELHSDGGRQQDGSLKITDSYKCQQERLSSEASVVSSYYPNKVLNFKRQCPTAAL